MKAKITNNKTPFLHRNNFTGILSNSQAMEFGELISQVYEGSLKTTIRVTPRDGKEGKEGVKNILSYFGSKYPYKKLGWDSGEVRYVLKDKSNRAAALAAMKKAINYYNTNRIKSDNNSLDNGTEDESEDNALISFISKPVNIIILLALLVGVYFLLKK